MRHSTDPSFSSHYSQSESNPFATKFIRAGVQPFIFAPNQSAATVGERLRQSGWWGQVLGPHGSGKTTLLKTLQPRWADWGREPTSFALHNGQRSLPPYRNRLGKQAQLIVDGFEQLSPLQRWLLIYHCRRAGSGLLVTTHRSLLKPTVYQTSTSLALARLVVETLTAGRPYSQDDVELEAIYRGAQGNIREMLLHLYDQYLQHPQE